MLFILMLDPLLPEFSPFMLNMLEVILTSTYISMQSALFFSGLPQILIAKVLAVCGKIWQMGSL
jgi:hypothetical protein